MGETLETVPLQLRVDPAVKARLEQECQESGRSLNNVLCEHVARALGLSFTGTGRNTPGTSGALGINLRLPPYLYEAIEAKQAEEKARTRRRGLSKNEVVERILCTVYGLEYVPRKSGPKASAAA